MQDLRYATPCIRPVGPFFDKTDGITPENSLTISNERITLIAATVDGNAPTLILDNVTGSTSGTDNDLNYIANQDAGMMQIEFSESDTTRYGTLILIVLDANNHVPVFEYFTILSQAEYDRKYGTGNVPAEIKAIANDVEEDLISAIWDHLMTAITTMGSVGKLIKDYLDSPVSDAIGPSAAQIDSQLSGNHGAGAWGAGAVGTIAYPDPVDPFLDSNNDPMVGVKIEAHSDSDRTALVDVQTTDINGNFQFHLNAGDYWFRASLPGCDTFEWVEEIK